MSDIARILDLPYRAPLDGSECAARWSRILARRPGDVTYPLLPIQGVFCEELHRASAPRGVFGAVGVGHGKTGMAILAGAVTRATRPLILTRSDLMTQFRRDLNHWNRHYSAPRPTLVSYSKLSTPESTDLLTRLRPDLIVCDEAHSLRHATSARTKRFVRYLRDNQDTRVVMLSGSFTNSSIREYAHLAEMSLRAGSFLPLSHHVLEDWSSVLDDGGIPSSEACRSLVPLIAATGAAADTVQKAARIAFQRKMRVTPGVIVTDDASTDVPLTIKRIAYDPDQTVIDALDGLDTAWELPNGEQLTDSFSYHRNARHLASGFYYETVWPNGVDTEWLAARKAWGAVIRDALAGNAREHMDSPKLVTDAAIRGEGSRATLAAWRAWALVKDRPEPPVRTVWLSGALVFDVLSRIRPDEPALLWFESKAIGEALARMGVTVIADGTEVPTMQRATHPGVSWRKHSNGKNLQAWCNNIIIQPPSNGTVWEQLLGRSHRTGQTSAVTASVYTAPEPFDRALNRARSQARYTEDTTGQKQRLNLAKWE